jgi:hypothetical protein
MQIVLSLRKLCALSRTRRGVHEANSLFAPDATNTVPNDDDFNAGDYANTVLVVEPLVQCLDLIHRVRRIDVIDADIRR